MNYLTNIENWENEDEKIFILDCNYNLEKNKIKFGNVHLMMKNYFDCISLGKFFMEENYITKINAKNELINPDIVSYLMVMINNGGDRQSFVNNKFIKQENTTKLVKIEYWAQRSVKQSSKDDYYYKSQNYLKKDSIYIDFTLLRIKKQIVPFIENTLYIKMLSDLKDLFSGKSNCDNLESYLSKKVERLMDLDLESWLKMSNEQIQDKINLKTEEI